ncbi:hypothetical protein N0V90_006407 [Kalmusia sp. IMI 367209]|nr:hypothetical protein N0V90_006407 [Kalmusia sp. IMI 367209]
MSLSHLLYQLVILLGTCHAISSHRYPAAHRRGSFENPSAIVRPKFRYWLPDASINPVHLAEDIAQIGQRGAGGVELLNYFNYGGVQGPPPKEVDWNIYGYATPAYRKTLEVALEAIKDNDLIMDFSMGPQSGQGVPAEPDEFGLSWELVTFNTTFNGSFKGRLPGWGSGSFVSLSAFKIIGSRIIPAWTQPPANKTVYVISAPTLTDLTQSVSANGSISVQPSSLTDGNPTMLFASYARRSYARANIATSESPQNILQNGSFAVDHFSRAGAKLTTVFLETHVVPPKSHLRTLLRTVGQYIWEDSVEIPTPIYWTPDLLASFEKQHDYDFRPYIPLLTGFNGDLMNNDPPISIDTDDPKYTSVVDDYRSTLTSLYKEYLATLSDWAQDYLGLDFSAQVGYNLPVDMLSSIPFVKVAETETLSFRNNIDAFRQYSGAASLAAQEIVSIELGADYGQPYSQLLTTLIEEASRAFAVGINQVVIHGATYSGPYPQTTYPGFTTFGYTFGGQHSHHQPAWNLGYKAMLKWLSRAQYVLQSGVPKVDLVFWNKQTAQDPFPDTLYDNTDLRDKGYSYTYLSPDNFALPKALVHNAILAPGALAAKALILRQNDTLTPYGVQKLAEYAGAGLPIIIQGNLPKRFATNNASDVASANATLHTIVNLTNVHQINANSSPSGLIPVLTALDIKPRTIVQSSGVWYTRYISSSSDSTTSVYIFSDSVTETQGTINVEATGIPLALDLWNGMKSRIFEYRTNEKNGTITIPLTLAAKQAVIIQFIDSGNSQEIHVTDGPKEVLGYSYDVSGNTVAKIASQSIGGHQITLSNNKTIELDKIAKKVPVAFNLSNWSLVAESWVPPTNLSEIDGVLKTNITLDLPGEELLPWPSLEGLKTASGIGLYSTTFKWPPNPSPSNGKSVGATLKIPTAGAIQGISVILNGHHLPNIDILNPVVDITTFLALGQNQLEIKVSTTLWNSLRPMWSRLKTGGYGPKLSIESLLMNPQTAFLGEEQKSGLVGAVQITPYQTIRVI